MSFYDFYQKIKTMQINNPQTNGNWELTPIDHVDVGVREEQPEEEKYKFNPEQGYIPDKEQLTLPAFTPYQPKEN